MKYIKLFEEYNKNIPIEIEIIKNPEPAPYMGNRFGQDVEVSGTYVLEKEYDIIPSGWLSGKAYLYQPLYINVDENTLVSYKYELSKKYKAKKTILTKKLMSKGYDCLITIKEDGSKVEIVLFPNASFILSL